MSRKYEFVTLAQREGANIRELCRRFTISPPTAYQLLDRYSREGEAGLVERSRRPQTHRTGPRRNSNKPSSRSAMSIPPGEAARYARSWRTEATAPCPAPAPSPPSSAGTTGLPAVNQPGATGSGSSIPSLTTSGRWTSRATSWTGAGRCHPLTVLDDHSRFSILLQACANERTETVRECLTAAFRLYGLPVRMLMDNGSPCGRNDANHPRTPLTVWLSVSASR